MNSFTEMFDDQSKREEEKGPSFRVVEGEHGLIFIEGERSLKAWTKAQCWNGIKAKVQEGKKPVEIFSEMYAKFAEMPQDEMTRAYMVECERVFEATYEEYKYQIGKLIIEVHQKVTEALTPPKPKRLFTRNR